MSYLFPRRVLQAEDVLDPIELTQDISPAAERLSGRLNAHNFKQTIAATVPVEEDAFYETAWRYVDSQPFISTGGGYRPRTPAEDPNIYRVSNSFEWQTIDAGYPTLTPLQVSVAAGTGVLWVNASAQYCWIYTGTLATLNPCSIQFAIRVDGSVLPDTITGIDLVDFRSSSPLKADPARTDETLLPGPQDVRGKIISSIGPRAIPIRITSCVPVQAGNRTVELVVRRMPRVSDDAAETVYNENDFVVVYGRQLVVVELKSFPVDSVTDSSVSAPGWGEEELITQAEIYTDRVQPIISGYNEVRSGNVQRGAFTHYHLPATLHNSDFEEQVAAVARLSNNIYPGFFSTTTTTSNYAGTPAVAWWQLRGLGPVQTSQTFDASLGGLILIQSNAQLISLRASDGTIDPFGLDFAVFCLMYKLVGDPTWYQIPASTGFVNSFALADGCKVRAEVPLMGVILTQDLPAGAQIEHIGVFGSVFNSVLKIPPPFMEYTTRRASILALHLRI